MKETINDKREGEETIAINEKIVILGGIIAVSGLAIVTSIGGMDDAFMTHNDRCLRAAEPYGVTEICADPGGYGKILAAEDLIRAGARDLEIAELAARMRSATPKK